MDTFPDFVEFYITCNPPLLPRGVDWVVRSATEAYPNHASHRHPSLS